jgi:UPF0271 protein
LRKNIDINCDLGEGTGHDEAIMPYISSANIACGFHTGDNDTIRQTIDLCVRYNVGIGAHPSFPDRINFGRKDMHLPDDEVYGLEKDQIAIMIDTAQHAGVKVTHVKPHGA